VSFQVTHDKRPLVIILSPKVSPKSSTTKVQVLHDTLHVGRDMLDFTRDAFQIQLVVIGKQVAILG